LDNTLLPASVADKLVLGTVQLGLAYGINNASGKPDTETAFAILRAAWDAGIRTLDTADAYGDAIGIIGAFHETTTARFRIITKFRAGAETSLLAGIQHTFHNLRTSSLYCYQYHRFDDIAAFPHIQTELAELKRTGVVERIGVSVYTNEELAAAADNALLDVIQLPFNALDNTHLRGEAMRYAVSRGKELHTRSVFLQGLFFKPFAEFPDQLHPLIPPLKRLHSLAESRNLSVSSLALAYALSETLVSKVLFGVETASQLASTLQAAEVHLDKEARTEIESIVVETPELLNPATWKS
jgi:uncharacterized protein